MTSKIAVVIPCYRVGRHLCGVIQAIGPEVQRIYVVDDACPESSSQAVASLGDSRVVVLRHAENQGVGGAVMTGYQAALRDGMDIIVKVDGDGQMPPELIPYFVAPLISGEADYSKGNRFFDLEAVRTMPGLRLFGNATLSLMAKLSTGYWNLFDPTNGYTAIRAEVARHLPFQKLSRRYFFETDMLFRLNTLRAVVVDVPMRAHYGDETSNLRISRILGEFLFKHTRNFFKRVFYNYYLRDMSVASIELPVGLLLLAGGAFFGAGKWWLNVGGAVPTPAGTVMLAALPMVLGTQLLLAFLTHDMAAVPQQPLHKRLAALPEALLRKD